VDSAALVEEEAAVSAAAAHPAAGDALIPLKRAIPYTMEREV
jgi:hypothetical protein